MKRFLFVVVGMLVFFLSIFFLVEALGIPILTDPSPWLRHRGVAAALVGVGLLIADIVLPVPSSLIMVAHGAVFGVYTGTLLSLAGCEGAALAGFAIGRSGGTLLEKLVTKQERERVNRMLDRWGALAIVITRPVPLLAETVAILAGASPMGWGRAALAALVGSLPPALVYALTGAVAGSFQNGAVMFVLVIIVTGIFWLAARWIEPHLVRKES
jgi:uncharacterized membrane protein YdjX (TVP38/TMEM64 family)